MFLKRLLCFFSSLIYLTNYAQESQLIVKLKAHQISIIEINTVDNQNVASKEIYLKAGIRLHEFENNAFKVTNDSTEIKGRGNSTWALPKKPFRLKFYKSISIAGMPSNRHWALLANFEDKSLSRTKLASDLGAFLGIDYVPRSIPVELVLNGDHVGSYQLIEVVKIDPKRINITSVNTKNNITTGGAIFELNLRLDDVYNFYTKAGAPISIKEPDDLNAKTPEIAAKHYNYLVDILNTAEEALYSSNFTDSSLGYPNYFNVKSVVDWYLTEEILKNFDIGEYSVFKFIDTKNKNKITYGPIWDFDLSSGNREGPIGFKARVENAWMRRFFEDPNFEKLVKEKWLEKRAALLSTMTASINQNVRKLTSSALADNFIWEFAARPSDRSFKEDSWFLKNWLKERVEWLDKQFSDSPISFSPIVEDIYLSTDEDNIVTAKLNASTSANTNAYFYSVKKPSKGVVEFVNNIGDFKYIPYVNTNGVDTFYFSKGDSNNLFIDSGRIIVNINPINDPPISTNYKDTLLEDTKLIKSKINGLSKQSFDADGDILNFELLTGTKHGTFDLFNDGSFVYEPAENFNGVDSFIYKVFDTDGFSNTASYYIEVLSVNDPPVATNYRDTILEDTKLIKSKINGLSKLSYDADGDILNFELYTGPKHGSLEFFKDGSFVYTPAENFNGVDSFMYKVFDTVEFSNNAFYYIEVLPVNDDPILIKDPLLYQIYQNEKIVFEAQGDLLVGAYDVDNDKEELKFEFDNTFMHGSIVIDGSRNIYYPDRGYIGVDQLSYRVTDKIGYSKYRFINIRVLPDGNVKSFNHVLLYPNPSKGNFYIDNLIADNVLIFDFTGNKVGNFTFAQNGLKLQVNGAELSKGQYIIYILYKNSIVAIKKISLI